MDVNLLPGFFHDMFMPSGDNHRIRLYLCKQSYNSERFILIPRFISYAILDRGSISSFPNDVSGTHLLEIGPI
jgi:hypothetical protein